MLLSDVTAAATATCWLLFPVSALGFPPGEVGAGSSIRSSWLLVSPSVAVAVSSGVPSSSSFGGGIVDSSLALRSFSIESPPLVSSGCSAGGVLVGMLLVLLPWPAVAAAVAGDDDDDDEAPPVV